MVDRQRPQHHVLRVVGVLILVDQDESVTIVERGAHLGVLIKQLGDVQQQVVEIDRRRSEQPLLVGRVDLGHDLAERTSGTGLVLVGGDQLVLGGTNRAAMRSGV